MNLEFQPPTEVEQQRSEWFRQRTKTGMSVDEFIRLNEEAMRSFPLNEEERRRKAESLKGIPEFVL